MTSPTGYDGHAFHPAFAGGKATGRIRVDATHIAFEHPEQSIALPREGIQFKLGGASDRLIFISHPQHPEWTLYTSDRAVLNDPLLAGDPAIRDQLSRARRQHSRNHVVLWSVVALLVALPVMLLMRMDTLTSLAVRQIPIEWERKLGETVFDQYRISQAMIDDKAAVQQLSELTRPLMAAVADTPFTFNLHLSSSSEWNAFALPGGIMVINAGLILAADSPEQVLGVVAHELAHVTQRHGVRNLLSATGVYLIVQTALGDVSGLLAVLVDAAPLLINQGYSRAFEADADQQAVQLLQRAGINPIGLVHFFEKMLAREQEMRAKLEGEGSTATLETANRFLSSHPATEQRIRDLQQAMPDQASPYLNLLPEFQQLKKTLAQLITEPTEEAP